MNKYSILLISLFVSMSCFTQTDSLYFSVSYFHDSKVYKKDTVTVKNTGQNLDIYFYKEQFYVFYGLPKNLIYEKYKNQTITEWASKEAPKEIKDNWTNT